MMLLVQLTAAQPQARLLFQKGTIACEILETVTECIEKAPQAYFELQAVDAAADVPQTFVCSTGAHHPVQAFASLPVHAVTRQYLGHLQQKQFRELRVGVKGEGLTAGESVSLLITIDDAPHLDSNDMEE